MNLLEEIGGKLPEDKPKMLAVIRRYQGLGDTDRLIYRAGRRGGAYRSLDDLGTDPTTYHKIKNLIVELREKEGMEGVERFLTELVDRYI
jgi:hypothetical protein